MKYITKFVFLYLIILINFSACKLDKEITKAGIHTIYSNFKNGIIFECKLNGQTVYEASENAYDVSAFIFDLQGKKIGECNWAWGKPDTICYQLQNCETIYRCQNHISGQPFTDKYGLSK
ncbi:MAG: hypothetical protein K9G64_03440 [Bacteroidia bacterium]|nr:hypothetical protein [Bacteroidia bacterium]